VVGGLALEHFGGLKFTRNEARLLDPPGKTRHQPMFLLLWGLAQPAGRFRRSDARHQRPGPCRRAITMCRRPGVNGGSAAGLA